MTFIATVISKNGAAIIADSLVTAIDTSIEISDFLEYLDAEMIKAKGKDIKLNPSDIINLFKQRATYTKDYEEKLFKYDNFTVITTAGSAAINGKRISSIIREIIEKNEMDQKYKTKKIKTKVTNFCKDLEKHVIDHIKQHKSISTTKFIFTHYDKKERKTIVYKIDVLPSQLKDLENDDYNFIRIDLANEWEKVICSGQNRISERILYGSFDEVISLIPRLTKKIINDFGIDANDIPKNYVQDLTKNINSLSPKTFEDMKIFKLSALSLQQAVDLASLLMRIEIDFQIYTENIPTVGGVVKIATLNDKGFQFVSGHEISKPNNI